MASRAVKLARRRIMGGERSFAQLQETGVREPDRGGFQPQYFSVRQAVDLLPPRHASRERVILAAARLGRTRLVDCMRVEIKG